MPTYHINARVNGQNTQFSVEMDEKWTPNLIATIHRPPSGEILSMFKDTEETPCWIDPWVKERRERGLRELTRLSEEMGLYKEMK